MNSAGGLTVTALNELRRRLVLSYIDSAGRRVEVIRTSSRARAFRPLRGSVWIIEQADGRCIAQFVATRRGVLRLAVSPRP